MSTTLEATETEAGWVSARVAAKIIGRSVNTVSRLGRQGVLRRHSIPGCKPLYDLDQVKGYAPPEHATPAG